MKGKSIKLVLLSSVAALSVGCVATDPFLNGELKKMDGAVESARRRGAAENCPEGFQTLVALRELAEKTYWGCDYWGAMEIAESAMKIAETVCPQTAQGAPGSGKEPMAKKGAPPKQESPSAESDSDRDNVPDSSDRCPGTPARAKVDLSGCWSIDETLFEFDRWEIRPSYRSILDGVADVLKKNPWLRVTIEGHTDNVGTAPYNQRLSEMRAGAVAAYLVSKGVGDGRLIAAGFGFSQPVASNDSPGGRALNRRVEIRPIGQEPQVPNEASGSPSSEGAR